jgi:DNA-binding IclR family transcriptional regulator
MPTTKSPVQGTAAFSKGIDLMQLIADAAELPTKSELVDKSGLPRQTVHRILKALIAEQLVTETSDHRFLIGSRMFQFAGRAIEQNEVVRRAEPELKRLSQATQETTHLAVRSGQQMVYLLKQDSPHAIRLATKVGGRVDMHASSIGKSLLAHLPENERDTIVAEIDMRRLTEFTIVSRSQLKRQLIGIQAEGYAISDQEAELDIVCFGAPIFDHRGNPIAGVSISVPKFRLAADFVTSYIAPLVDCCRRISQGLGGDRSDS